VYPCGVAAGGKWAGRFNAPLSPLCSYTDKCSPLLEGGDLAFQSFDPPISLLS